MSMYVHRYSCPELIQRKSYTDKADIWSLGVIMYQMVALKNPFTGMRTSSSFALSGRQQRFCEREHTELSQHCGRKFLSLPDSDLHSLFYRHKPAADGPKDCRGGDRAHSRS